MKTYFLIDATIQCKSNDLFSDSCFIPLGCMMATLSLAFAHVKSLSSQLYIYPKSIL